MRVFTAEWNTRSKRYRIRRREIPMRDGEPAFATAICLRPRWFRSMREALALVNERQAALPATRTPAERTPASQRS